MGPVSAHLRRDSREILRCGLKFTTPRLVYASLVASERKLRMTQSLDCPEVHERSFAALRMTQSLDCPEVHERSFAALRMTQSLDYPEVHERSFAALRMTQPLDCPHTHSGRSFAALR